MKPKLKRFLVKSCFYCGIFIVICLITYVIIANTVPDLIPVLRNGNRDEIETFIRDAGEGGIWLAALLQFLQVVSVVFPGAPIQISCGLVFGVIKGYIVAHLSYVLANTLVFVIARKLGSKMDDIAPGEVKKPKYQKLINSDHPTFMVFMTCLIPIIPNGCIPYLAANTGIRTKNFFAAVFMGSAPAVLMFSAVGHRILTGDYALSITYFMVYTVLLGVLLIFKNKLLDALIKSYGRLKERRIAKIKR